MTFDHRLLTTAAIAEGDVAVGARGWLTRHDVVDAHFAALTNIASAAGACCGRTARGAATHRDTTRVATGSACLGITSASLGLVRATGLIATRCSGGRAATAAAATAAT